MKKKLQHGCFIDDFVKLLRTHFLKNNSMWLLLHCVRSHPAIACSKLTMETLEQRFEICSKLTIKPPKRRKLTIKPPKRRQRRLFGGFVNFEHISNLYSSVSIVNFEYVIAGWVLTQCRSSHMELFFKKGVLKSLTKSSIKHPCWSLFFNIVSFLKRKL